MKKLYPGVLPILVISCMRGDNMEGIRAPQIRVTEEGAWINSQPLTMSQLKGKVVLLDIWDYTCVNCIRTIPRVKGWYDKYKDKGLVIIGVHTPEFGFAKERANVEAAVREFGITYPVVMDNDYEIWSSYANMYWPRKYLIDKDGAVRYDHAGEGGYEETERRIQELLKQINPDVELPDITNDTEEGVISLEVRREPQADMGIPKGQALPRRGTGTEVSVEEVGVTVGVTGGVTGTGVCYPMTPELYLGFERGNIGNREGYKPGKVVGYRVPDSLVDGYIYARGEWRNEAEAMIHARNTRNTINTRNTTGSEDYIAIRYHAIEVNAVIKPEKGKPYKVFVKQDNQWVDPNDAGADLQFSEDGRSYLDITEARMYRIVNNAKYGTHTLELSSTSDGFGIYAFTFGACSAP